MLLLIRFTFNYISLCINIYLKSKCFIFGALIGAHMAEAMFVKHLAYLKGVSSNSTRWVWWIQTFYFGFPSTQLMTKFDPKKLD